MSQRFLQIAPSKCRHEKVASSSSQCTLNRYARKRLKMCSESHTFSFCFTAAALTNYILLHAVWIQLGHTTSSQQCIWNFDPLAPITVAALAWNFVDRKGSTFLLGCFSTWFHHSLWCQWAVICLCYLACVYICVTHTLLWHISHCAEDCVSE